MASRQAEPDKPSMARLQPGDMIGILGGGQLSRMLAMAAARLGLKTTVLEPDADCPAGQVASRLLVAPYDDPEALRTLAESCRVVTYEFENIPISTVNFLEENNNLFPSSSVLATSQDRLSEKAFIAGLGISTATFEPVDDAGTLARAVRAIPGGGILKTRRFGYDGKGQVRIAADAPESALADAWGAIGAAPAIYEGLVPFEREISVIAARDRNGRIVCYDPAENLHRDGILHRSRVPAAITAETAQAAIAIAESITDALGYIGVMGIEMFVLADGSLLVNEIAPRVHNSGHWTEAACDVSQFEQHIRAIAGWPLAVPYRHSDCVMENLIGNDMGRFGMLLSDGKCLVHLYGKAQVRPGRKMGHVTWLTGPCGAPPGA